jgi:hypothetical protein
VNVSFAEKPPVTVACVSCGEEAKLELVLPHSSDPVDNYYYRCPGCGALSIVSVPRSEQASADTPSD